MTSFSKLLSLLLPMTLSVSVAFAEENLSDIEHTVRGRDRTLYVITYKESDIWKTQIIESRPGQLQKSISVHSFLNRKDAKREHFDFLKNIEKTEPMPIADENADQADMAVMDVSAPDTGEYIWPVQPGVEWNADWEQRFSQWVSKTITPDFFKNYNLPTDCADVVISSRWIFARINGLPMASTLTGSGQMIGQMSMPALWRNLPTAANWYEDQRFLTALNYVLDNTYTRSLSLDSYPIAINKSTLIPGSHHLEFHEIGGHAMLVKAVEISKKSARIRTLNSTLPRAVRTLIWKDYVFGDQAIMGTGFQRVKWPVRQGDHWTFMDESEYPGYSTEQYLPEFMNGHGTFSAAVAAHLSGNMNLDLNEWKNTLLQLTTLLHNRVNAVYDGYHYCSKADCSAGSDAWDEWSTPGRDDTLSNLVRGVMKTVEINQSNKQAMKIWSDFLKKSFPYDEGKENVLSHRDAISLIVNGRLNSDPRVPIAERWGL